MEVYIHLFKSAYNQNTQFYATFILIFFLLSTTTTLVWFIRQLVVDHVGENKGFVHDRILIKQIKYQVLWEAVTF